MRKIKFRAWWKDTMKPIPNFTDDYVIDACNEDIFIVCQCIGLKDKNGKEIYEGDIVRWGENIETVFYSEQDAAFQTETSFLDSVSFEVVGNVYENPELLEAE